jgi:hypothetical protein
MACITKSLLVSVVPEADRLVPSVVWVSRGLWMQADELEAEVTNPVEKSVKL